MNILAPPVTRAYPDVELYVALLTWTISILLGMIGNIVAFIDFNMIILQEVVSMDRKSTTSMMGV